MIPQPLYNACDQTPAYHLRYTWCGWPSGGRFPDLPSEAWIDLTSAWEADGLRLLEREPRSDRVLLTFSTTPDVSPVFLASRAKGRLDYACRRALPTPMAFSRKVSVRSIGDNTTETVQKYIESQVANEDFVDPRFADFLAQFSVVDESVNLTEPSETNSGRYWYNLHLVLVTDGRYRFADEAALRTLRDGAQKIARKKAYRIARLSVMPDHLHIGLRGAIDSSPGDIALAFQNNLAFLLNRGAIWRPGYYVGTFGEYDMNAVRVRVRAQSSSPATQGHGGRR